MTGQRPPERFDVLERLNAATDELSATSALISEGFCPADGTELTFWAGDPWDRQAAAGWCVQCQHGWVIGQPYRTEAGPWVHVAELEPLDGDELIRWQWPLRARPLAPGSGPPPGRTRVAQG
jgi:hypothetical protein